MGWKSFFKKAGAVAGSVAIRSAVNVLRSKGSKAQGRDFVYGTVAGLAFGSREPLTKAEVINTAVDYAVTSLKGKALQHAKDYIFDLSVDAEPWPK